MWYKYDVGYIKLTLKHTTRGSFIPSRLDHLGRILLKFGILSLFIPFDDCSIIFYLDVLGILGNFPRKYSSYSFNTSINWNKTILHWNLQISVKSDEKNFQNFHFREFNFYFRDLDT